MGGLHRWPDRDPRPLDGTDALLGLLLLVAVSTNAYDGGTLCSLAGIGVHHSIELARPVQGACTWRKLCKGSWWY